ncbi:MAG: N-acetylmuramyl-l-alanine amidase [Proteobacteria bacterium]|nr:N-acetylmuramyl-l-alanine amidase [Pseudomonadota bacterium]
MEIQEDWLEGARHILSPHCDDRPDEEDITLIVIHGISLPPGEFGGEWIERLFTDSLPADVHPYFESVRGLHVSAHVLIRRDGAVTQFVPFHKRAWHAGVSRYGGRDSCNDYSVGIELEGTDYVPYTDIQYERLAELIAALCRHHSGLIPERIVGHSDIAPGRKTDPGPHFDWQRLHRLLAGMRVTPEPA